MSRAVQTEVVPSRLSLISIGPERMNTPADSTDGATGHSHDSERSDSDHPGREDGVSLIDVVLILVRQKQFVVRAVAVFLVLGLFYAILKPPDYTSQARVLREVQEGGGLQGLPGGLGGISSLQGLGVNIGGEASGLNPETYPEILTSREVQLAVVRDTFYFPGPDQRMTFAEYTARPGGPFQIALDYTIKLPWTLKRHLGDLIGDSSPRSVGGSPPGQPVYPTEEEEEAMEEIEEMLWWEVDQESGIMTISVTADDPKLAASMTKSFLGHLRERVQLIRTEKAKQNLSFIEQRFEEAKKQLQEAEEKLAQFTDRNKQINSARLRTQRDRLQRQVTFASDLYSQLQGQKTQAEIELQRSEPVVTVVEEPVPPMKRSAPRRTFVVLISLIVGGIVGVVGAFTRWSINETKRDVRGREKVNEIRRSIVPEYFRS